MMGAVKNYYHDELELRRAFEDGGFDPAEACTDPSAHEPHEVFYVQFAPINFCDDGETIRKWSRTPFEGARMCRVALPKVQP